MAIRSAARVAALLVLTPALFAPAAAARQPSSRSAEAAVSGGAAQPDARRTAQHTPSLLERLENPTCLKPGEETPEIYGPTDVGAAAGNGSLSAAVDPQGTLSVLRWPVRGRPAARVGAGAVLPRGARGVRLRALPVRGAGSPGHPDPAGPAGPAG